MSHPLIMIGYAVFLWWFSTGLILLLNRLPRRTFPLSLVAGTGLFAASLGGLWWSRDETTVAGALCAFSCGLIAWGWQELTFYLGYVTGPRTHACKPGCSGWKHFGHALQVSLYHELSILITGTILVFMLWDAPNRFGLATFGLIMMMHQSARLNVFLGVRNVIEEWAPPHLPFLVSFLNNSRSINLFWPISQGAACASLAVLVSFAAMAEPGSFEQAGFTLVSAILTLGILEHVFMIVPLPLARLWHLWEARVYVERSASHSGDDPYSSNFLVSDHGVAGLQSPAASSTSGRLP